MLAKITVSILKQARDTAGTRTDQREIPDSLQLGTHCTQSRSVKRESGGHGKNRMKSFNSCPLTKGVRDCLQVGAGVHPSYDSPR